MPAYIYKITADTENYRTLHCIDDIPDSYFLINGRTREKEWKKAELVWDTTEKPEADFTLLLPNAFVINHYVKEILLKQYYFKAEYLPVLIEGKEYFVINFRDCVPALNTEVSKINRNKETGEIISIKKYSFIINRLPPGTVFKILEMQGLETYCYQYVIDIDREFIFGYRSYRWSGLLFEKIYSFPRPNIY